MYQAQSPSTVDRRKKKKRAQILQEPNTRATAGQR
jgi:hypothetical protein